MRKYFEAGKEYRDKGSPYKDQDQFLRWFKGPLEKTIANNGGIRRLKSHSPPNKDEATCVVLVSNPKRNHNRQDNPWEDKIDLENGRIEYWGDAKVDEEKRSKYQDSKNNEFLDELQEKMSSDSNSDSGKTKEEKIKEYIEANPEASGKEVSKKFDTSESYVYKMKSRV
jgi:hypothetical protein